MDGDAVIFVVAIIALGGVAAVVCLYIDTIAGTITQFWSDLWARCVKARSRWLSPSGGFLIEDNYPLDKPLR